MAEEEKNDPTENGQSEETPAEETPAADEAVKAEESAAPEASAKAAEPGEKLSPKQIRKQRRSTKKRRPQPQLSPEQRAEARAALRKKKATARRAVRLKTREQRRERGPREGTPPAVREAGIKRIRQGVVVSNKADKTITVSIANQESHRIYEKVVRSSTKLHAHDEKNEANPGDTVRVIESRPLSRTKRWRLVEIVERAE